MKLNYIYRVDPRHLKIIEDRDSNRPHEYSIRHNFADMPEEFLLSCFTDAKNVNELLFEKIRKVRFPTKPSRLKAIFGFPDLETAVRFQRSGRTEPNGIIAKYKVERLDLVHVADMDVFNAACNLPSLWETFKDKLMFAGLNVHQAQEKLVDTYWQGMRLAPSGAMIELLVYGNVRLVDKPFENPDNAK